MNTNRTVFVIIIFCILSLSVFALFSPEKQINKQGLSEKVSVWRLLSLTDYTGVSAVVFMHIIIIWGLRKWHKK